MQRILIVRLGALGDIVHALPVAAALRRAWPTAQIDWLVGRRHKEIVGLVPVLNDVVVLPDGAAWAGTIRELRRRRYEVALDLQGLIKSAVLARASGADRVIGFAAPLLRERPAGWFYSESCEAPADVHVVGKNLAMLGPLGVAPGPWEFPLRDVESPAARSVTADTGSRYAVVNPGAAWPNKRWPADRLGAVAAWLRERHGLVSVVTWGPDERSLAESVVAASDGAARLAPPTRVSDLVPLLRGAALMVSGDTGPTHIAAAVGTPIVGLFGPTRPRRNGPWAAADVTVSRDQVCQCHHLRRCRLASMCLLDIQVADVTDAIERRFSGECCG